MSASHEFMSVLERPWALVYSHQGCVNRQPGRRVPTCVAFLFGKDGDGYIGCEVRRERTRVKGLRGKWCFMYARTRRFRSEEIVRRFDDRNRFDVLGNSYGGPSSQAVRLCKQLYAPVTPAEESAA